MMSTVVVLVFWHRAVTDHSESPESSCGITIGWALSIAVGACRDAHVTASGPEYDQEGDVQV